MTVTLAETEIGGIPEPRRLVVQGAGFLRELRRVIDGMHHAIVPNRDGRRRAFDYRWAGTPRQDEKTCEEGEPENPFQDAEAEALLPNPAAGYLSHMNDIEKHPLGAICWVGLAIPPPAGR